MNQARKRLAAGLGLVGAIVLLVAFATTSAFAFTIGTDQPSTANGGSPSNTTGSLSLLSMRPASTETFTANYTYVTSALATVQNIDTMYQQWRHNEQNNWFYLYARNINDAETGNTTFGTAAAPQFAYFYYVPGRGATQIATGGANAAAVASQAMTVSTIYLDSGTGTNNPAFLLTTVQAGITTAGTGCAGVSTVTPCTASFTTALQWGIAQQGFRAGTMTLLQAVESQAISTATISQRTVYYDAWESPTGSANQVTLGNTAPAQAAAGVTNATGTRQANLGVPYSMDQTVTDVDGNLLSQSLIWVFTSGTNSGQWFEAGIVRLRDNQGEDVDAEVATDPSVYAYYQDWRTAMTTFAAGASTTVGYFTQLTILDPASGATGTAQTAPVQDDAQTVTSSTTRYSFIYGADARGGVTIFGRAGDWHGATSGNVQVGTQTIT